MPGVVINTDRFCIDERKWMKRRDILVRPGFFSENSEPYGKSLKSSRYRDEPYKQQDMDYRKKRVRVYPSVDQVFNCQGILKAEWQFF